MLRPCSSEIDDGLSLARQYGGRGVEEVRDFIELYSDVVRHCYCTIDVTGAVLSV